MPWVAAPLNARALLVFISLQSPPMTAFLKTNAVLNSGGARADSGWRKKKPTTTTTKKKEPGRGNARYGRHGGGEHVGNWPRRCRPTAAAAVFGDQKSEPRPSSP